MTQKESCLWLAGRFAPMFTWNPGSPVNRVALIKALMEVETDGGDRAEAARFEPHLVRAVKKAHPGAYRRYGDRLAASYGPMQVLATTALELGMEGPPDRLAQPEIGIFWAIEYLNTRLARPSHEFVKRLTELDQVRAVADLYNSGNAADANKPIDYIEKVQMAYKKWKGA